MAKVFQTWYVWDDQHETREFEFLVSITSRKQLRSLEELCVHRFNGQMACDGSARKYKGSGWYKALKCRHVKTTTYNNFVKFLNNGTQF